VPPRVTTSDVRRILHAPALARYGRPGAVGLLGTMLISLAASLPGAPFAFKVPGAWFFGVPALRSGAGVAHASGFLLLSELACGFAGIVLLSRAWLTIHRSVTRSSEQRPGRLGVLLALWSVPLLVAPPMFSNDIYSYAAQGEMVSHHISPYLYGPGVLGASPFSTLAQGVWINTPSPYGPFFSGLEGDLVQLSGHRILLSVVFLRLVAVAGVALIAIFLPSLARSYGRDPSVAFSLGLLNPLVPLFLIASGHNDAFMLGLLVAGLSLARRGHVSAGIIVCALAGAVKVPGLIGVFAIAWTVEGTAPRRRRWRALAEAAVIAAATFELLSVLSGLGWGWVRTLGAADAVTTWITPGDLLAKTVPTLSRVTHLPVSTTSFLAVAHLVGPVLAFAVGLWALRGLPSIGLPRAMGLFLLAVVLLSPTVQPWYLTWPITLLAVTAGARTARAIEGLSIAASILGVVGLGQLMGELTSLGLLYQVLFALVLAATILVPIRRMASGAPHPSPIARYASRWRPSPALGIRGA
jgi:alpha-1,6-mannosyltransferase